LWGDYSDDSPDDYLEAVAEEEEDEEEEEAPPGPPAPESEEIARAIAESFPQPQPPADEDEMQRLLRESEREARQTQEIRDFLRDKRRLRSVLAAMPGVNPDDPRFAVFAE
jgi:hypothetical protein